VVPKPQIKVSGTGLGGPWEARHGFRGEVDSRLADALRQWEAKLGGDFMAVPFPSCPNCKQLVAGPDWRFCPHCGTKLPCDEEVGAEAK
jgi:hypothetical protein